MLVESGRRDPRPSVFPSGGLAGVGWVAGVRGSILLLDLSVLEI